MLCIGSATMNKVKTVYLNQPLLVLLVGTLGLDRLDAGDGPDWRHAECCLQETAEVVRVGVALLCLAECRSRVVVH